MNDFLMEERFDFLSRQDKAFIIAFNGEMTRLGYSFGDKIGGGFCWGKYMMIYTKAGVKSKKVFARIYMRDAGIVLRLFLNEIDQHRSYLEQAPSAIQEVFVGDAGNCQHCHNEKGGVCKFRKSYTLNHRLIEKCNGITFEFHNPSVNQLRDYMALFAEFYPNKNKVKPLPGM